MYGAFHLFTFRSHRLSTVGVIEHRYLLLS